MHSLGKINFLNPVSVLYSFNFFFDYDLIPFNDQFYSHSNLRYLELKIPLNSLKCPDASVCIKCTLKDIGNMRR